MIGPFCGVLIRVAISARSIVHGSRNPPHRISEAVTDAWGLGGVNPSVFCDNHYTREG